MLISGRTTAVCPRICLLFVLIVAPGAWAAEAPPEPIDNDTCLACHGDPSADRAIDPAAFGGSIHGALQCTSCHQGIAEVPHPTPVAPVSCRQCHELEAEVYGGSDHGKALHAGQTQAASCRDCHGEPHQMRGPRDPASPVFRANIPKTCAQCHGKTADMARFRLSQAAPIASYEESVHGQAHARGVTQAAVCTDCHGSHDLHRATNPASKLYWQTIPSTCGTCHENIRQTFQRSVHGGAVTAGKRDAPVCTDCHGEHGIAGVKTEASKVFPSRVAETCGQCHAAERITTKYRLPEHVVETYMDSFHGLAVQMGSVTAANCASCHGAHDILPSSDARSSVHPANLAQTCGKCHAGVTAQVASGQIHSGTQPGLEHRVTGFVRRLYLWLIGLVIGGMVLHNLLDFLVKLRRHYARMRQHGAPRMTRNERLQHGLLILAFATLAYTGFALTAPQAWWASPFVGRFDWRSDGHRAAAILFVALGVYHVWFMLFTPRGRHELRALAPRREDLIQPFQMLAYYLGRRAERPVFARYSYVEKAEYWALVWGSMIMTVTGALLTWEGWTLRHFPKWLFDVVTAIHYYEAILACLAILVWHVYFVIFDPDEYPMKWTWVTGRASEADRAHRRDDGN
jgi:cytochrome b subunit of formate dehydrogenase